MPAPIDPTNPPYLVWVFPDSLTKTFNTAPRLEVTRELRRAGWQVDLVAPGPAGTQTVQGVEITSLARPDVYFLRQLVFHARVLAYLLKRWNAIDLVMFHQMTAPWMAPLRLARLLARRKRPLLVLDTRTVPMESPGHATLKDRLRGLLHDIATATARWVVDGQTAITYRMAQAVGIPEQQLWGVWPSGVNLETFAAARDHRLWPTEKGDPVHLVYIGMLTYERNLLTLCQAVEQANRQGMRFKLTLAGDGSARRQLEDFASGTQGQVTVSPPIPHTLIPRLLAKNHVGVLPFPDEPKFRVSSPIKLFEYLGAGMPVLLTRITCHTDVIGPGSYAIWAEDSSQEGIFQALCQCWQQRDNLPAMGQAAADAAPAWTWQASAHKLKNALETGLNRANGAAQGKEEAWLG